MKLHLTFETALKAILHNCQFVMHRFSYSGTRICITWGQLGVYMPVCWQLQAAACSSPGTLFTPIAPFHFPSFVNSSRSMQRQQPAPVTDASHKLLYACAYHRRSCSVIALVRAQI